MTGQPRRTPGTAAVTAVGLLLATLFVTWAGRHDAGAPALFVISVIPLIARIVLLVKGRWVPGLLTILFALLLGAVGIGMSIQLFVAQPV